MRRASVLFLAVGAFVVSSGLARPAAADPLPSDPWWGPDKALHFGASAAIAGGGYGLGALAFDGYGPRIAVGAGLGLTAGVGKELLDAAGLGHPSWKDLTWDILGTAVGVGIALSIDLAIRGTSPAEAH